jgi:hypothetical protein
MTFDINDGRGVMQHLKDCGFTGQPLTNVKWAYHEATLEQFIQTLRSLENDGYIKLVGPRTLDDMEADEATNTGEKYSSFFSTWARITMRGRFALATGQSIVLRSQAIDLEAAKTKLEEKRRVEKEIEEERKSQKVFEEVINAETRNATPGYENEWQYSTKYWKEDHWKADDLHNKLLSQNAQYKESFETLTKAFGKFSKIMHRHEDSLKEGSLLSRIVENPFTCAFIGTAFALATHLPTSIKMHRSRKNLNDIYAAEQKKGSEPTPSPS